MLPALVLCAALTQAADAGAQATGEYGTDLARVYGVYQLVTAIKEECDSRHPGLRKSNEAAYAAWKKRHQALIDELERRLTALIRGASTDEKDYARNIGKYEGAMLQRKQEHKDAFLAQGIEQVERECKEFPQYLKSEDADLGKRFTEELQNIRKRK